MIILQGNKIERSFSGDVLFDNINIQVDERDRIALVGRNGAGKSTLLRLLTAEFFPSEGKAEILGYTFGNGDITGLRQHIGIVSSFITERLPQHMTAEKSSLRVNTRAQSSTKPMETKSYKKPRIC